MEGRPAPDLVGTRECRRDLVRQPLLDLGVPGQVEEGGGGADGGGVGAGDDEGLALAKELVPAVPLAGLGVHGLEQVVEKVPSAVVVAFRRLLVGRPGPLGEALFHKGLPVLEGRGRGGGEEPVQTSGLEPDPEGCEGGVCDLVAWSATRMGVFRYLIQERGEGTLQDGESPKSQS